MNPGVARAAAASVRGAEGLTGEREDLQAICRRNGEGIMDQVRGSQSLILGKSIFSSQKVFVPLEQLLLHTAVMGKSGVGKTTLLKQLIAQFQSRNIPVFL